MNCWNIPENSVSYNIMKTKLFILPVLLLCVALLGGCATRYAVRVDALSAPGAAADMARTYSLVSDHSSLEESDLFFKEVAAQVDKVLAGKGLRPARTGGPVNLQIGIEAYLSEPLVETRSHTEPIYLESRGYLRTVRIPVLDSNGKVVRYAYRDYWTPPRTHFAGYVDRDQQVTVYDKILVLSARRIGPAGDPGEEVWNVRVALRSRSTDYREALPYMLLAAEPYIGKRTGGEEVVVIREDDPGLVQYLSTSGDGR